jgi:hypothetical protein
MMLEWNLAMVAFYEYQVGWHVSREPWWSAVSRVMTARRDCASARR